MTREEKQQKAKSLHDDAVNHLSDFIKCWRNYYHECGHDSGMSFEYELVEYCSTVSDLIRDVDKVHKRVSEKIKDKLDFVDAKRRSFK